MLVKPQKEEKEKETAASLENQAKKAPAKGIFNATTAVVLVTTPQYAVPKARMEANLPRDMEKVLANTLLTTAKAKDMATLVRLRQLQRRQGIL